MRLACTEGILGFEDVRAYELVEAEEQGPFKWLKAAEGEPAFIVVEPGLFRQDYAPDLEPQDIEDLGISKKGDAALYVIVTVPDDPLLATANFYAPIVINRRSGRMKQVILRSSDYPLGAYLFPEYAREGKVGLAGASSDTAQR